ncbi:hypothetical protein A2U01_0044248 [Trifolium medium]|uniref:Transmembrane protein n=1 Tax=Trifolium medium TaxID=97028 RepID=A0A392QH54_9FABA|nr:hypothetical protein [Trifolium medium]
MSPHLRTTVTLFPFRLWCFLDPALFSRLVSDSFSPEDCWVVTKMAAPPLALFLVISVFFVLGTFWWGFVCEVVGGVGEGRATGLFGSGGGFDRVVVVRCCGGGGVCGGHDG